MEKLLVKNGQIVNEGTVAVLDILISGERIERIDRDISDPNARIIEANGLCVLPGCIDDQVHFREPGLTHKADIASESRAAVAGGVTSFMEMPNTVPNALTGSLLEDKYQIAAQRAHANYSFYMGVSNENLEEVLKVNYDKVCGIKVFMGSSTGNMLVDDPSVLDRLFANAPVLVATHCEDEATIRRNMEMAVGRFGKDIPPSEHPNIRSREACLMSSSFAVELARKYETRLHVLHITTRDELILFDSDLPLSQKRITAEACVHHLYFDAEDYAALGNQIKCNPAIKLKSDADAIADALKSNRIDVVATDHAPHTWEEKSSPYAQAPSGLPLVQHALPMMLTMSERHGWDLPFIVRKMAHDPAICFQILDRGFIREGYYADLVLLDANAVFEVVKSDLLYKCGWSPLEGRKLKGKIKSTLVNGQIVFDGSRVLPQRNAKRLEFFRA